jgi:hypothetical protein
MWMLLLLFGFGAIKYIKIKIESVYIQIYISNLICIQYV